VRTKIQRKVSPPTGDSVKDITYVTTVLQDITDDLSQSLTGGLSIDNLPFSLYKKRITSGTAFETEGFGAVITFSSNKVKSFNHKQLRSNQLQVTITTEDNASSDVILLLIKESV